MGMFFTEFELDCWLSSSLLKITVTLKTLSTYFPTSLSRDVLNRFLLLLLLVLHSILRTSFLYSSSQFSWFKYSLALDESQGSTFNHFLQQGVCYESYLTTTTIQFFPYFYGFNKKSVDLSKPFVNLPQAHPTPNV